MRLRSPPPNSAITANHRKIKALAYSPHATTIRRQGTLTAAAATETGSTQSLVDAKKQQPPVIKCGAHVIAFGVTNLGVVLVPYPPNSEESPETATATDAALAAADADTTVDGCASKRFPHCPALLCALTISPYTLKKGLLLPRPRCKPQP